MAPLLKLVLGPQLDSTVLSYEMFKKYAKNLTFRD